MKRILVFIPLLVVAICFIKLAVNIFIFPPLDAGFPIFIYGNNAFEQKNIYYEYETKSELSTLNLWLTHDPNSYIDNQVMNVYVNKDAVDSIKLFFDTPFLKYDFNDGYIKPKVEKTRITINRQDYKYVDDNNSFSFKYNVNYNGLNYEEYYVLVSYDNKFKTHFLIKINWMSDQYFKDKHFKT